MDPQSRPLGANLSTWALTETSDLLCLPHPTPLTTPGSMASCLVVKFQNPHLAAFYSGAVMVIKPVARVGKWQAQIHALKRHKTKHITDARPSINHIHMSCMLVPINPWGQV